ncbi:MAG: tripartite tricarboxylate transporter substrate binding protein [Betaproteobacteria bacterium]|nr:tripartite tricarboxylate transporter substrate binding protein [Betaproteobacteria bacterium]
MSRATAMKGTARHAAGALFLAVHLLSPVAGHAAETFPVRPLRMIAPFSAGGGADTVARMVAQKMSDTLSRQVIVDNRPGASNIIGTELTARAAPDGYTFMIANTVHAINAGLFRKLPYDPIKDFAPISMIATTPFMLIVHPSLPVKSVRELVAVAKAKPGQINYASAGTGTAAHLAMEMFRVGTGIDIVHIPYKGISQALIDTVAGTTQAMILSPITALPQVKAGRVRAMAVTTAQRSNALPDIPTLRESGVAGYEFSSWYGLLAPRAVPGTIIARLNGAVLTSLQQKDLRDQLAAQAAEPAASTPAQFGERLRQEIKRFSDLVRQIKLQVK